MKPCAALFALLAMGLPAQEQEPFSFVVLGHLRGVLGIARLGQPGSYVVDRAGRKQPRASGRLQLRKRPGCFEFGR